jgi:hypothetical protein
LKFVKLPLAALAALVFLILANTILFPLAFPDGPPTLYRHERSEPLTAVQLLAFLVTSVLLAYIFPIGYRGGKPWSEGMRFGMLMGVLVSVPMSLHVYATAETTSLGLVSVVLWTVITWGISGALIGAVYGKSLQME